jgi:hypothetical protein
MKKSRILGYALTLAATLFVGSAMGQVVSSKFILNGTGTDDKQNLVTIGGKLHAFVQPDLAYNPLYNTAGSWAIATGHTWSWTAVTGFAFVAGPAGKENYVEIGTTVGTTPLAKTTLTVVEKFPAGFSCTPISADVDVIVLETPSAILDETTGKALGTTCNTITSYPISIKVKAAGSIGIAMTLDVYPVTFNTTTNAPIIGTVHSTSVITANSTATAALPWSVTSAAAFNSATSTALANYVVEYTRPSDYTIVGTDKVTLYRYNFVTGQGVNDFVSRKSYGAYTPASDTFVADATYFGGSTTKTVDIYVASPPKTGPVYHIGNNIAI